MAALGIISWALITLFVFALAVFFWASFRRNLRYQIGRSSLRVTLGYLTVRRIEFTDIERVDKPRRELRWVDTENWRNTFDDSRRLLVVHRRSGWWRKFVITPKHRYQFRRQLRAAVAQSRGEAPETGPDDADETDD
jgi:hypothetical protein